MAKRGRAIPEHKKHQVFPGFKASAQVKVENTTIKPVTSRKPADQQQQKFKPLGPEWDAYEAALSEVRNTGKNASSAALQLRKGYEEKYHIAARRMMREGKLTRLKKKYR
jgi:hypothetical protein